MNTTAASDYVATRSGVRVLPILGAIISITVLGDVLFWRALPGVSLGIFAFALGALLIALRPCPRSWLFGGLLLAACVQTGIEVSLSNVIVLALLLVALLGETFFDALPRGGARIVEAAITLLQAPARWFSFGRAVADSPFSESTSELVAGDNAARALRVILPGAALCALFAVVLSSGNAVLKNIFSHLAADTTGWLMDFDFSLPRFALWAAYATLALGLLWPGALQAAVREWTQSLPRWQRPHRREALWQSVFALIALNALFFAANTIDVMYLWRSTSLPPGVNPTDFVHAGVWSLIIAVMLSAVVLAGIFQQQTEVAESRVLKSLGLFWVLQNCVLIAGVFLRLKLYVDAYLLTERRVYVGCFLALVATGFLLLAWSILRRKGLHWLISGNVLATFALFFALQFPNVAGAVARYNVGCSERDSRRELDLDYIMELGPNAWPVLTGVARNRQRARTAAYASELIQTLAIMETPRREERDWRSWQARREAGVDAVLAFAKEARAQ